MASRRFSATDIRESALLVVSGLVSGCDCRNSPQQLPLPALFLRLWVCRAARTRLGSRGRRGEERRGEERRGEERRGEGEKRRTADSTESVATVQYSTYIQTNIQTHDKTPDLQTSLRASTLQLPTCPAVLNVNRQPQVQPTPPGAAPGAAASHLSIQSAAGGGGGGFLSQQPRSRALARLPWLAGRTPLRALRLAHGARSGLACAREAGAEAGAGAGAAFGARRETRDNRVGLGLGLAGEFSVFRHKTIGGGVGAERQEAATYLTMAPSFTALTRTRYPHARLPLAASAVILILNFTCPPPPNLLAFLLFLHAVVQIYLLRSLPTSRLFLVPLALPLTILFFSAAALTAVYLH
ncbi:hypothetical protein NA56DRAFT_697566 [Hyaloscypha hepaticicola]|uniref:Uncharacterized protein n=1 Tax=Hyaloscypha hepaticicola TaxID=2082293 RepID=A0A2J6QM82_9HELO|nr:hypothetical protein NA56DRAFT_697566 [Hyaloscypha hepaticicola]